MPSVSQTSDFAELVKAGEMPKTASLVRMTTPAVSRNNTKIEGNFFSHKNVDKSYPEVWIFLQNFLDNPVLEIWGFRTSLLDEDLKTGIRAPRPFKVPRWQSCSICFTGTGGHSVAQGLAREAVMLAKDETLIAVVLILSFFLGWRIPWLNLITGQSGGEDPINRAGPKKLSWTFIVTDRARGKRRFPQHAIRSQPEFIRIIIYITRGAKTRRIYDQPAQASG